jgi:hypothetical protein
MAGVATVAMLMMPRPSAAADTDATASASDRHVRSDSASITALIEQASQRSATFRQLVDDINASDATVYLQDGKCLDSAHACFIGVTMAGSRRNLWVRVNMKVHGADWDAMGSIAHELRHTLEVVAVPSVTSTAAMELFYGYAGAGFHGSAHGYETWAAIDAGNTVRSEVRQFNRRTRTE